MASKDSLGDRMKENYENRFKFKLLRRTPVIVRIDGKAFHSFTRGFNKPFDKVLSNAMDKTMQQLCENIQGCVFGYTQSDEITLILNDYKSLDSSAWFDNEVQKICSVAASMATAYFNRNFQKEVYDFYDIFINGTYSPNSEEEEDKFKNFELLLKAYSIPNYDKALDLYEKYSNAIDKMAMFDARCFNIPESEVANCVIFRQKDATRNSIEMVGRTYFSDKELHKKNCSNIQDMLMTVHNVNWNDFPVRYKRGCACHKVAMCTGDGEIAYQKWFIDYNMPIITQDREYVEKWVKLNN